ncbi:MAG TPA: class I SAM-dependent methyltransferase [Acidimicrobiales bacterium]|nr:class I SAM-dependent methyltransferase [Acidimicrobiales bacterium]
MTPTAATWNRDPVSIEQPVEVRYGPDIETEAELRLLGPVAEKRVLELGCGSGRCSVAFAAQGAHAIAIDFSPEQLTAARRLSERDGVKVELHEGDLADLAFVRAESIDIVFSTYALSLVEDINRIFRQVHRVLKEGAPFVFSVMHPASVLLDEQPDQPPILRRSYFDKSRIDYETDSAPFAAYVHTISDLFSGLSRANFHVDLLLEPEPQRRRGVKAPWLPPTLVVRARKEGL